jgi:hypothetical protein
MSALRPKANKNWVTLNARVSELLNQKTARRDGRALNSSPENDFGCGTLDRTI